MLSRRNARVKVMQTLYAFQQDEEQKQEHLKMILEKNLQQSYELYLYNLLVIREIAEYSKTDAAIKKGKYLPTEQDKMASAKLTENSVITFLRENERFNKLVKKYKLQHFLDQELIRSLFQELSNSKKYRAYISRNEISEPKEDKDILEYLYKNVLLQQEEYEHHLDEHFLTWHDDQENITFSVMATVEDIAREKSLKKLDEFLEKMNEAEEFANEILDKTLSHSEEYTELIAPKLQNWEVERIAVMDMILMKMALTEILDFPSIPIKVTMNEYIDISKKYSTPKSKEFINGVLDKLMKELQEEGRIFKSGRGLMDN